MKLNDYDKFCLHPDLNLFYLLQDPTPDLPKPFLHNAAPSTHEANVNMATKAGAFPSRDGVPPAVRLAGGQHTRRHTINNPATEVKERSEFTPTTGQDDISITSLEEEKLLQLKNVMEISLHLE